MTRLVSNVNVPNTARHIPHLPETAIVEEAFLNDPQIKGRESDKELKKLANDMIDATIRYLPEGWR